jgi:hypothetical protein
METRKSKITHLLEFKIDGSTHEVDKDVEVVFLFDTGIQRAGVLTFDSVASVEKDKSI